MASFTGTQIRNASSLNAAADMVAHNLETDAIWLARGLIALLKRQTSDEVSSQATRYNNGRGFNGSDAYILTSFAKQCQRWFATPEQDRRFNTPLSPKQLFKARIKMKKYAAQLARVAREPQTQTGPVQRQLGDEMVQLTAVA